MTYIIELKLQGGTKKKGEKSKHLESVVSSDGSCEEQVGWRIKSGWIRWRKRMKEIFNNYVAMIG